jgi:hypothetical protein
MKQLLIDARDSVAVPQSLGEPWYGRDASETGELGSRIVDASLGRTDPHVLEGKMRPSR